MVTSLLLWGTDFVVARVKRPPVPLERMRGVDALLIGCFQALAIAPGLSRSGSTIAAGVFLGFDKSSAARFSFLLSVPAIFGAFLANVGEISTGFAGASGSAYAVGAVAAGVTGFLAIYLFMRWLKEHRLRGFGIYTAALGILTIVLSLA